MQDAENVITFLNVIFVFAEIKKKSWSQKKLIAYLNSTFFISRDVAITVQAIYIFNISRKKEIQNSSRKFIYFDYYMIILFQQILKYS